MTSPPKFKLEGGMKPKGDQPSAIAKLISGFKEGKRIQTLLGVTGSGKTFTVANVVQKIGLPTIVISHNKTLAAQLYNEFRMFFPKNRVEYFVSYYDYYQPESYIPESDMYIEKDASINEKLEQLRLSATTAVLSRPDTIVVSSVSCIYGLGSPQNYRDMSLVLRKGEALPRSELMRKLLEIQYSRNDAAPIRGQFRARGGTIDVHLGYEDTVVRVTLSPSDKIARLEFLDPLTGAEKAALSEVSIFPARHFVMPETQRAVAIESIRKELEERLPKLGPLEAQRLKIRTKFDLEMIEELGYCSGIENYSRHFDGRAQGQPPSCLLNFFPEEFLMVIDESHVTMPQLHGMYFGDFTRKKNLVDNGFRLPSAYDNRPLKFDEFRKYMKNVIFVSATPADFELKLSGQVAEQIVRPTGLVDPKVEVRPAKGQIPDLIDEVKAEAKAGRRVLVTTLTKRMAEDLTEHLLRSDVRARYLHSEIETLERPEILRDLRLGKFDCLVGINLLREGLDLPEVALVAILDADREGFLRNARSLIQTFGRAARNVNGRVLLYGDTITGSMKLAIAETDRRRRIQIAYNEKHHITPQTIIKAISQSESAAATKAHVPKSKLPEFVLTLEAKMRDAANRLDFEEAIKLREQLREIRSALEETD